MKITASLLRLYSEKKDKPTKPRRLLIKKQGEKHAKHKTKNNGGHLVNSNRNLTVKRMYGYGKNTCRKRTRAKFDRLLKDNGLAEYGIHFHSLRHTFSSMLFEAGVNPKVIQMLLGHKDVKTTIKTYNSVDRSYFAQATSVLNKKPPIM